MNGVVMIARWDEQNEKIIREPFIDSPIIKPIVDNIATKIKESIENPLTEEELKTIEELWQEIAVKGKKLIEILEELGITLDNLQITNSPIINRVV